MIDSNGRARLTDFGIAKEDISATVPSDEVRAGGVEDIV
jgi:hypothetical protein